MRDKTPLVLMEQLIMLLVFALAAALCLRAFIWADTASERGSVRDQAVLTAERAAETLKACGGDYAAAAADFGGHLDGTSWRVDYDAQWNIVSDGAVYHLWATPVEDGLEYMGSAALSVTDANGEELSSLQLAWQEVLAND